MVAPPSVSATAALALAAENEATSSSAAATSAAPVGPPSLMAGWGLPGTGAPASTTSTVSSAGLSATLASSLSASVAASPSASLLQHQAAGAGVSPPRAASTVTGPTMLPPAVVARRSRPVKAAAATAPAAADSNALLSSLHTTVAAAAAAAAAAATATATTAKKPRSTGARRARASPAPEVIPPAVADIPTSQATVAMLAADAPAAGAPPAATPAARAPRPRAPSKKQTATAAAGPDGPAPPAKAKRAPAAPRARKATAATKTTTGTALPSAAATATLASAAAAAAAATAPSSASASLAACDRRAVVGGAPAPSRPADATALPPLPGPGAGAPAAPITPSRPRPGPGRNVTPPPATGSASANAASASATAAAATTGAGPAGPPTIDLTTSTESEYVPLDATPEFLASELASVYEDFPGLGLRYRLTAKLGEGTFSSVYRARRAPGTPRTGLPPPVPASSSRARAPSLTSRDLELITSELVSPRDRRDDDLEGPYEDDGGGEFALKRIYFSSSPSRIAAEVKFLMDLGGRHNVIALHEGIRNQDHVLLVLEYFPHTDFRQLLGPDPPSTRLIRQYLRALFESLAYIHVCGVLHRDLKPANFLFHAPTGRARLVDFGLAQYASELQGPTGKPEDAASVGSGTSAAPSAANPAPAKPPPNSLYKGSNDEGPAGFYDIDDRPRMKAARTGTRGFRAPEVLLKNRQQTSAIDIWSAGVVLLTLCTGRYPFFLSHDDLVALWEIRAVVGHQRVLAAAEACGRRLFCSPVASCAGLGLEFPSMTGLDRGSTQTIGPAHRTPGECLTPAGLPVDGPHIRPDGSVDWRLLCESLNARLMPGRRYPDSLFDLLDRCLDPVAATRATAAELLHHPFLMSAGDDWTW